MERLFVIVITLGLTVCQKPQDILETEYSEGKQYVYKYESQILSGLPDGARTYAGTKLSADVIIEMTSTWKSKMQLRNPRLYKINDRIEVVGPKTSQLPEDILEELVDEDIMLMKEHLIKPVSFSYVLGHVEKLSTESHDPDWSVDMKKAILSLLEMNFNERQSLDPDVDIQQHGELPVIYRVMEPSISGDCETMYRLKQSDHEKPVMDVEKIRSLDRCLEKVTTREDMIHGHRRIQDAEDMLSGQSSVTYTLLGKSDKFLIVSALAQSQYNLVPHTEDGGRITTFINQSLVLVEKKAAEESIKDLESPKLHERALKSSMNMKDETDEKEAEENFSMMKQFLEVLDNIPEERIADDIPQVLLHLRMFGKKLNKEHLLQLVKEHQVDKRPSQAGSKLLDILPSLGTQAAVETLVQLMKDKQIPSTKATLYIMSLSLIPKPDIPIIRVIKDFILEDISKDKTVKRAAWLSLGALGHKLVIEKEDVLRHMEKEMKMIDQFLEQANDRRVRKRLHDRRRQLFSQREEYMKDDEKIRSEIIEMVTELRQKEDVESQLLAVKVSGALGYKELMQPLVQIIRGPLSPRVLKLEAISSLPLMEHSLKVCAVLVPIYLTHKEPDEIRMLALKSCLSSEPSLPEIEMVASSLLRETNRNIRSFTSSLLKQLSKKPSSPDCVKSLARNVTLAARLEQEIPHTIDMSNYVSTTIHYEEQMLSSSYECMMLYSEKDRVPSVMSVKLGASLKKEPSDIVEIGYKAEGLGSIADAVFGDQSSSVTQMLEKLIMPRYRRGTKDLHQEIRDIQEKVDIKAHPNEKPEGHLYMKVFGQELIYLDIQSLLPSAQGNEELLKLLGSVSELLNIDKSLVLPLFHQRVPTEAGLPLNIHTTAVSSVSLKTDMQPDLSSGPLQLLLNIKPRLIMELGVGMEIDLKYIRTMVSVKARAHVHAPMSLHIQPDLAKSKMIIKIKDETVLYPVAIHVIPKTVIHRIPSQPHNSNHWPIEEKDIVAVDGVDLQMFSHEYGADMFGRRVTVMGELPIRRDSQVPMLPLSGRMFVKVKYEPVSDEEIYVQIQHVKGDAPDRDSSSEESSSWWGWLPWSGSDSKQDSQERKEDPYKGFIDLEKEELSLRYLEEKFVSESDMLRAGSKCGLVVRVAEPGPSPKYELQLSTLYQADEAARRQVYSVEVRHRADLPGRKPWKLVNSLDIQLPDEVIEPSDLRDDHYQSKLKQEIASRTSSLESVPESLLHLLSSVVSELQTNQEQVLKISIEDLISHVVLASSGHRSQELADIIEKLRIVHEDIEQLKDQSIDPARTDSVLSEIRKSLEKSDVIIDKVKQELRDEVKHPEFAPMIHYIVMKQEKSLKYINVIIQRLVPVVTRERIEDVKDRLKESKEKLAEIQVKQKARTLQKVDTHNVDDASLKDRDLHLLTEIQKLKEDVLSVSELAAKKDSHIGSDLLDKVKVLIGVSETFKEKIDQMLLNSQEIHKIARANLLDELLLKKILIEELRDRIKSAEKELDAVSVAESLKKSDVKRADKESGIEKLLRLTREVERESAEMGKYLMLAIKVEVDKASSSLEDKTYLDKLMVIQTRQIIDSYNIDKIPAPYDKDIDIEGKQVESPRKLLKEAIDRSKISLSDVITLIDEVKKEKQEMGTILIPSFKVLIKQARLVTSIKDRSRSMMLQESIKGDKTSRQEIDAALVDIETEAYGQMKNVFKLVVKLERLLVHGKEYKALEGQDEEMKDMSVEEMKDMKHSDDDDLVVNVAALMKKTIEIDTAQFHLNDKVEKVLTSLMPVKSSPRQPHDVQTPELINEVISEAKSIQIKLQELQGELSEKLKDSRPESSETELLTILAREYINQGEILRPLEMKLKDRSLSDVSLFKQLQDVQKLKDSYLRHEQLITDLISRIETEEKPGKRKDRRHKKVKSRKPKTTESDESSDLAMDPKLPDAEKDKHPVLKVSIAYGSPDDQMKKINIKIISMKSLEQLLREQELIVGRDSMGPYRMGQFDIDNPLAAQYQDIKQELNTDRHIQILSTYEPESIPEHVQLVMLRIKDLIKHRYYDHVSVHLPDFKSKKGQLLITFDTTQDGKWIDAELRMPSETIQLIKVRAPVMSKMITVNKRYSVAQHLSKAVVSHPPAVCSIVKDRLRTIDGQIIELNKEEEECEHVLITDRSPRQRLLITSRRGHKPGTKIMKIVTPHVKIEIIPDSIKPVVKVDGKIVNLDDPLVIRRENQKSVIIKEEKFDRVHLQLPLIGVTVISDGKIMSIQVPQLLRGQLTGLCGNYDDKIDNDKAGPQRVNLPDDRTLAASYMVPAGKCEAKAKQQKHTLTAIREKSKDRQPHKFTQVIRQKIQGKDMLCLSTKAVKKCLGEMKPVSLRETQVSYHCLPVNSPAAKHYKELARHRVVKEIQSKSSDLKLPVQEPALCTHM